VSRLPPWLRAAPALLRVGLLEAFAYRAEFIVWMLSTTMPFIMLALMSAVAREGAIAGFDGPAFTAYYMATLLVRHLTGSWVVWQMVMEIRQGTLALKLVRPLHPLWFYFLEQVSTTFFRSLISVPLIVLAFFLLGAGGRIVDDGALLGCAAVAIAGAWVLNFALSATIGTLGLYIESSVAVWDLWIGCFMIFSGYLLPIELFPPWLASAARAMPFPYLQSLPVEIMTGRHDLSRALALLERQGLWAVGAVTLLLVLWRRGVRRFAAYGG
jgi:ABC-2 type transport system permease protein